ncbi:MAG: DNA mismatch repair protein MutS, partial [Bacteroides sp.]|nr:DNA mismatch repair protein MutS [Bacteroides sp.]
AEGPFDYIDKLLNNFAPKEVLFERGKRGMFEGNFGSKFFTFELEDWAFNESSSREKLLKHFETKNLKGFGVEHLKNGIVASGAILQYLDLTQHHQVGHITSLSRIEEDRYVRLDKFTVRSLELLGSMNDGGSSLLGVIDKTISPMGARLLKRWVVFPLKDEKPINERLDVVEFFFREPDFKDFIEEKLHLIGDLERIVSKAAVGRISPREVVQLKVALQAIEPIKNACLNAENESLRRIGEHLNLCESIRNRIAREIKNDPPLLVNKGGVIADGINAELDELRQIAYSGKDYLLQMQQRESERTEIPSLKIAYNNVFGYYIEVRNAHKDKVPAEWIRKQTLVNAERYITQELKEYEEKILGAEDKILSLETKLYNDLVIELAEFIPAIQINATQIARLDCLLAFANVARENKYIRPVIEDSDVIDIRQGRHPVIEKQLPVGEKYIANDVLLDADNQQIIIITGPNMAGKSALLRQTALITLLAQIGCFVPAESARIGLVDKIFTRVGASDNISLGESTFMVEMNEAADILNNLSPRSLVLFDELGRGTSTYDGISIAWAIVEHIHEHPKAKARTLFATHYHELNEMEKSFKRIKNYNVSVKEVDGKVIFLRKLERGGSEHSFGIHVAKLAGMPKSIVKRANTILNQLETDNRQQGISSKPTAEIASNRDGMQLSFFQLEDPVLCQVRDEILNLDVNNLTPLEALNKLNDIKKIVRGK